MSITQPEWDSTDYTSGLGSSEERELCKQIVLFLTDHRSRKLNHISLGLLKAELDNNAIPNDVVLFNVVMHISSCENRLLDMKFKLIDRENDKEYLLTDEDIHQSMKENILYHPYTGIEVPNFKDCVTVYFQASKVLKDYHEYR